MTTNSEPPARETGGSTTASAIALIVLAGAATAVALGVYGAVHTPAGTAVSLAGFSSPGAVKSWLATVVVVLAVGQDISALAMYGLLPRVRPGRWASFWHVWSGRLAVLISLPVAVHCLYAFGFATFDTRVLVHSLLGCLVYGIFVTKMLLLTRKGLPGWVIPVAGGLLFTGFVGLWFSSAVWYFRVKGFGA
ncbi:hypothetical protein FOH10_05910 [Nocardia otitidiscaviarum]|uniref:Uncharacterized protein n=1 Tax=Nocardia otitidiscaviarum TaxID=1823 RepID=A0A516NHE8_9NOCA|nr:DUF6529 family protein [Nocardia otitidiscaviarum]MCP9620155.1 DUF6529 family protein [Nocardia otitidiscaviarum]QDP78348.1 hypothetical protein FOH10_05910 [Nocardia otitidiscaviarum]